MNIKELTQEFENIEEIRSFAEKQFTQILELSKKIKDLEEEKEHLKELLQKGVPLVAPKILLTDFNNSESNLIITSDAKVIADIQLKLLKDRAQDKELTLEETKKVEIYSKIISADNIKPSTIKAAAKTLDDKELMKLISND